jgi:isoleucyl-tRNA synthetase
LDERGEEMHKSSGNVIWLDEAAETMGADVMRWMYYMSKPENNMLFGYGKADEAKRRFLIPLWNVYSFFVTYANIDKWTPKDATFQHSLLDRWLLSKLQVLVREITTHLEGYDPYGAATNLERFVDELSRWYVRRSRRRFWKSEADSDKKAGYATLYTCLTTLVRLLAPFLPFLAEEMHQNLLRNARPEAPESVHHDVWPVADTSLIDEELMEDMDLTVRICGLGRSARNKAGIKLRQPLNKAIVAVEEMALERLGKFTELIKDELNVEEIVLTSRREEVIKHEIRLLPNKLGAKHGLLFPKLRDVVASMDSEALFRKVKEGQSVEVEVGDRIVSLLPGEVEARVLPKEGYALAEEQGILVGVRTIVTEELKKKGLARDIVRRIQNQRKKAGFDIDDQIETYFKTGSTLTEVFAAHGDYIASETLSTAIRRAEPPTEAHVADYSIDGESLKLGLIRIKKS